MPKKSDNFRPDPSGASKVRDKVTLVNIILNKSILKVSRDAHLLYEEENSNRIISQTRKGVNIIETKPVGTIFWVDCFFGFRDVIENKKTKDVEVLFTLEATFKLTYELRNRNHITKNDVASFGVLNGPYNAWPYWREFHQNTMLRAGLPPIILDLMLPSVVSKKG